MYWEEGANSRFENQMLVNRILFHPNEVQDGMDKSILTAGNENRNPESFQNGSHFSLYYLNTHFILNKMIFISFSLTSRNRNRCE